MTVIAPLPELHALACSLLSHLGLRPEDARLAADAVCYADARGINTHGLAALTRSYAPALLDGRIDATAAPVTVVENGAVAVLDGRRALGLVTMTRAMDRAAGMARRFGVGAVAVRNSTHIGATGHYAHRAAHHGLIGIAATNCGTQGVVPPLGGTTRMLGTNPIAAAVPAGNETDFVLDMSTTVVATGKVGAARRAGIPVPEGWLVGKDGHDVTDPNQYYEGNADVRWLGGSGVTGAAKGFGLGLLVDLLCGPLAGAGFGPRGQVLTDGPTAEDDDIGHFALAIDPAAFGQPATFLQKVDELLGTVAGCPPAPNASGVTYPGQPEARLAAAAESCGAALPDDLLEPLHALATQLGVPLPEALQPRAVSGRSAP